MTAWVFEHGQLERALAAYETEQRQQLAELGVEADSTLHSELVRAFLNSEAAADLRMPESHLNQGFRGLQPTHTNQG